MEIIAIPSPQLNEPGPLSLRCPACRQNGTFEALGVKDVWTAHGAGDANALGSRRCPNPTCRAHVFVVFKVSGKTLLVSYPPEMLEFDPTNLPKAVLDSLEEGVRCHAAQCFRAAALLVRRTLEELCADRGVTGSNLKARLDELSNRVALPPALIEGLNNLRLLGNDAAHIELKDFDAIGQTESELAIETVTEILKSVYQYEDLVARLGALKTPRPTP